MILCVGLILLTAGWQEYRLLSSSYNPLFTISPDRESMWLMILGAAGTIGGFVGLLRGGRLDDGVPRI